jgi:hypothetical protein
MKKKVGIIILTLLITATFSGMVNAKNQLTNKNSIDCESLTVTIKASPFDIFTSDEGESEISMMGFSSNSNSGNPKLPYKILNIGVPPGGEVVSIKLIDEIYEIISGSYKIVASSPISNGIEIKNSEKNNEIYSSFKRYPSNVFEYLGMGQLRKYCFAKVGFSPIIYIPKLGKLIVYREITLEVNYKIVHDLSDELLADNLMDDVASEIILNYPSIHKYYDTNPLNAPLDNFDYVIITTQSLEDSLVNFTNWKEYIGYSVKVMKKSTISTQYTGIDLEEKIRNFLIDKYDEWGIKYVLIVGSHSIIPMRYCQPDITDPNLEIPTDYYYADLTGNWDEDGDGKYGEMDHDSPDFNAEVWIGRIPVDDPDIVEDICEKTISFEQDDGIWKKKTLSCGPIMNYENIDNSGNPKTDLAVYMEMLWNDIYKNNGFSRTTMYEKDFLDPSPYPCDFGISNKNVTLYWPDGYGIVNLDGHGSPKTVKRSIWFTDDGDGIPETGEFRNINYFYIFNTTDLNNDKPSIVLSIGCSTSRPDDLDNIGSSILINGGVSYIGASRTTWYKLGWDDVGDGYIITMEYYIIKNIVANSQTCAEALYKSKLLYSTDYAHHHYQDFQNLYIMNLYGDPTISLITFEGTDPPSPPIIEGPTKGKPKIEYDFIFNSVDPDGDDVKIIVEWDDGYIDETEYISSGTDVTLSHSWQFKKEYTIQATAIDINGMESTISSTHSITIPRNRMSVNTLLNLLFERFIFMERLIKFLL